MEALRRHIYLEEEIVFPRLPPGPLAKEDRQMIIDAEGNRLA